MSLLGGVRARGYDAFMDRIDQAGGEEYRRRLVEEATGEVLEVGIGTGRNLTFYGSAERVVAIEPDRAMRTLASEAARKSRVPVSVVEGDALNLPFDGASFDTVVFSLVLCTVPKLNKALAEACRVLRPGGTLRFFEHVRSNDPRLSRWQDRLERPWGWLGGGCHPNRDTVAAVKMAGFDLAWIEEFDFPAMPWLVRPHAIGFAKRLEGSL